MSECSKCGITDREITPKQIKKYLGENSQPKEENEWKDGEWVNSYWEQTDRMFFVKEFQTFCKTCE
jgi:hypothetical protein